MTRSLRMPDPCLAVLVGATGAGKSAWAGAWFHADQVVSSDRLRALAEREGVPAYAVVLDTPEKVVRERNRARGTGIRR